MTNPITFPRRVFFITYSSCSHLIPFCSITRKNFKFFCPGFKVKFHTNHWGKIETFKLKHTPVILFLLKPGPPSLFINTYFRSNTQRVCVHNLHIIYMYFTSHTHMHISCYVHYVHILRTLVDNLDSFPITTYI